MEDMQMETNSMDTTPVAPIGEEATPLVEPTTTPAAQVDTRIDPTLAYYAHRAKRDNRTRYTTRHQSGKELKRRLVQLARKAHQRNAGLTVE